MEKQYIYKELDYYDLGVIPYAEAWAFQQNIFNRRKEGKIRDSFIMLEHPHTYTLGKVAKREHLLLSNEELADKHISVFDIDRGGDITYHGPGQIVGYPIINLADWQKDSHKYLRTLEEIIIDTLKDYDVDSGRIEGLTGVWVGNRKIAAIGIKISSWITMHGFALNINTELDLFTGIIPCGITDKEVTSLQKETGRTIELLEVKENLLEKFMAHFNFNAYNRKLHEPAIPGE
jgi:lipoyl(octanoyl) transferase